MPFLTDGYSTTIGFSRIAGGGPPLFLEIAVSPGGLSQRGAIDITSMRSIGFLEKAPKVLTEVLDIVATVAYDPTDERLIYTAVLGTNQIITITYPDGTIITFNGFLDEYKKGSHKEGDRPTAEIKICPSNLSIDGSSQTSPTMNGVVIDPRLPAPF